MGGGGVRETNKALIQGSYREVLGLATVFITTNAIILITHFTVGSLPQQKTVTV